MRPVRLKGKRTHLGADMLPGAVFSVFGIKLALKKMA